VAGKGCKKMLFWSPTLDVPFGKFLSAKEAHSSGIDCRVRIWAAASGSNRVILRSESGDFVFTDSCQAARPFAILMFGTTQ
jgi:hypothetical protein